MSTILAKTMLVLVGVTQPSPPTLLKDLSATVDCRRTGGATLLPTLNVFAYEADMSSRSSTSIIDVPRALSKIDALRAELHAYELLLDGWDGEGSKAPNVQDVSDAIELTMHLPAGIPTPRPMISSSGEIGMYWNGDRAYADIAIEGNGTLSLFTREKEGDRRENFAEGVALGSLSAEWLADKLNAIAS